MSQHYLIRCLTISLIILLGHANIKAMMSYNYTSLPAPAKNQVSEEDKEMLKFIASLPVYKDDKDTDQYYYVPIFKVKNYKEGAASLIINEHQARRHSQLEALSHKKYLMSIEEYDDLSKSLHSYKQLLDTELKKPNPTESIVSLLKNQIATLEQNYTKIIKKSEKPNELLPLGIRMIIHGRMYEILAMSGIFIEDIDNELEKYFSPKITEALKDLSISNGGFFTLNIYAGLSDKQVSHLKKYKQKYFPNVKLTPIPVEKLSFNSLSENVFDESGNRIIRGLPIFRGVKGSGSLSGATINLDITVGGASSFARNLSAFIPPVGIMATLKQQVPPFEAILNCKISNGFSIKGRTDQRDGLIIYNDDITAKMNSTDHNNSDCKVELISGDREAAEFISLLTLQKELDKLFQERTVMSKKEKDEYYQKNVQNDLDTHHHTGANNGWHSIFGGGWSGFFIGIGTNASKFYWHTNIQDVEFMSNVVIKKHIKMNGYQKIDMAIPASICLTYNVEKQAYTGCTEEIAKKSRTLSEANIAAKNSFECRDVDDAVECGEIRQEKSARDTEGNLIDL